jgi:anti-sigma B factor antagonist
VHEGLNGDRGRDDLPESGHPLGDVFPAPTAYARTYRRRQATVVELSGEIDLGSAHGVHPHLDAVALLPLPLLVVFDLGPVEFIDCYGLELLVRARRRVLDRGGRTAMACDHPPTRKLLAMTGLDDLFRPVATLDDALRD